MLRFFPPVTFTINPCAPAIETPSSSGLEIAMLAASTARFSPVAIPVPINASPISRIIVRTSAKSKLIKPGTVISSEIPLVAL